MTPPSTSLWTEGKTTLALAVPLIIGQLSQMLMGITDTLMIGQVGVTELAALTLANAIFHVPFVFGIGLTVAISVLSSAAFGKNDQPAARSICRNGLFASLLLGLLLCVGTSALIPLLPALQQPPQVVAATPPFLILILVSIIPALGSMGLKAHTDSLGRTWTGFWIFLAGVILNIGLNGLFIFALDLGLVGAGIATLISRTAILIAMIVWLQVDPSLREVTPKRWFEGLERKMLQRFLTIGGPSALHLLAEIGAFSTAGFLVGLWGENALASHQVALTTAAFVFMVPLGLSMAITIRIGNAKGAGQPRLYRRIAVSGWALTTLFALTSALIVATFASPIARSFVMDPEVIALSAKFLVVAAIFQIVDGLQIASAGILRGLEDVSIPAWIAFVAYWIIGLPVGWLLAKRPTLELEAIGIWWGLAVGLSVAAIVLSARVWHLTGKEKRAPVGEH